MIRINHAILHVFDFETGSAYLSDEELPLNERQTKSYVQRHLRRITASAESRHAEFAEGSLFAEQLAAYLAGENDFLGISVQVAQWFWEELRRADSVEQADLLVADFEDTGEVKVDGRLSEGEIAAQLDAAATSWFAVIVLPRRVSFVHDVEGAGNAILRHDAMLPNPTQKVASYLLVRADTLAIEFSDKPRLIGGREVNVIADDFLKCHSTPSGREVVSAVTEIVEEVAEEFGLRPAMEVSRAKAALVRVADVEQTVTPLEVGREVFADRPEVRERFEQAVHEQRLPEEVSVRRGAANRLARKHKIVTDTGVEITFPAELAERPGYIEFIEEADGRLTIQVSNVAHIENR